MISAGTSTPTTLALFDLDHTLLPLDSDYEWGRFMVRLGLVDEVSFSETNERFYKDYQAGCLDIYAYLRYALAPLARHSREQLNAWHQEFMHTVIRPVIQPVARELIAHHEGQGALCCIVTATNRFVTGPIAAEFGVPHLIAPLPATLGDDPFAAYTGEVQGIPSYREGKISCTTAWLKALQKDWTSFTETYFYSDSLNDLPLLEHVTHPIATNPDAVLRAHALAKNWPILDLF